MYFSSLFFQEGCLNRDDSRVRKVPMFFGRPNLTEMNRVYRELVTVTLGRAESESISEVVSEMVFEGNEKTEENMTKSQNSVNAVDTPVDASNPSESSMELSALEEENSLLSVFWSSLHTKDIGTMTNILHQRPYYGFLWYDSIHFLISRDSDGETPLHLAAKKNDIALIQALLEGGCDPCVLDEKERVPFTLCSSKMAKQTFIEYRANNPNK